MPTQGKKTLVFCTFNKKVKERLCESAQDIIGHEINIQGYSTDEKIFFENPPDLVVTTGTTAHFLAEENFPGVPVIDATLVLMGRNLEKVMAIPANTRVLIISKPEGIPEISRDLLVQAGINHLIYDCYWPGKEMDLSHYEYALSPDMFFVCPNKFKHMINLHPRAMSVRTFVEILDFFGLSHNYADVYENRYFRTQIDTCQKVVAALKQTKETGEAQSLILDEVEEAIISMDGTGKNILFANRSARELFKMKNGFEAKNTLHHTIQAMNAEEMVLDTNEKESFHRTHGVLLNIEEAQHLCRKRIIRSEGKDQILYTFRKTTQIQAMEQSLRRKLYRQKFSTRYTFQDFWGDHSRSKSAREKAEIFAATDQTILITGESGTGKEILAQTIHNASARANAPFVGVNLASIAPSLVESELFGYEEGAFTGARKGGKPGLFEVANNGTVFLDEIGDAPLAIQILLLRVLEERVITRVGGYHQIPINVRIIAATNRPLFQMIKSGEFRSDLYYRLNSLSIQTVPLRDMREHVTEYINRYEEKLFQERKEFSEKTTEVLKSYDWPGNFRELKNVAEYLYYTAQGKTYISERELPEYLLQAIGQPLNDREEELEQIRDLLLQEPMLLEILRVLKKMAPQGVGRGVMGDALAERGLKVSEAVMRRKLMQLKKEGLIRVGSTRQGSFITENGIQALEFMEAG